MDIDSLISLIQWPAMAVTLLAAWLVSCEGRRRRYWGFWCFILSNVLWIAWGWHDGAYSLIALQLGLFMLNVRGERQNDPDKAKPAGAAAGRGPGSHPAQTR